MIIFPLLSGFTYCNIAISGAVDGRQDNIKWKNVLFFEKSLAQSATARDFLCMRIMCREIQFSVCHSTAQGINEDDEKKSG